MTPQQQIYAKEEEIRLLLVYESAFVVDENGSVVLEKTSDTAYEIAFTEAEIEAIRAAANPVFTHNHPRGWNFSTENAQHGGSSFSPNDLELACKAHLAEIRAVSPKYRFSIKPAAGRFQESDWQIIKFAFDVEHAAVKLERGTAVMQRQLSREAYVADVLHETWKRVAAVLGLKYTRTEE